MSVIEQILESCPEIKSDARYWYIRTNGGQYFSPFREEGIIGLDYDLLKLADVKGDLTIKEEQIKLTDRVKGLYQEHKRPGLITSHLTKLKEEIKTGDFIVIPNVSSVTFSIGVVTGKKMEESKIRVFNHRTNLYRTQKVFSRRVKWVADIPWSKVDPRLERSFRGQQTIVEVTDQSHWMDILLYDFFKKDDTYHFILKVDTEDEIPMKTLRHLMGDLEEIETVGSEAVGAEVTDDIKSKVNINSPGYIELISNSETLVLIALGVYTLVGGQIVIPTGGGREPIRLGTNKTIFDGIEKLMGAISRMRHHETVRRKFDELDVQTPSTIERMVEKSLGNATDILPKIAAPVDNDDNE